MAIYKRGREFELGTTEHKSSKWPERDSNPGPPDCESDALTTRPRCLLRKVLTVEIYSHTVNIEKISICLNRAREESVGNDDVSIVCARKYEMVRMT